VACAVGHDCLDHKTAEGHAAEIQPRGTRRG
jgi:hypothetical protein